MNIPLAIECAEAIAAMYRGDLKPTIVAKRTDTQVRIEQAHEGEFVVIFPGTASTQDWITDLKVHKARWDVGKVHRGFAAAYNSVADEIRNATAAAQRLIITGHSLGGALATLCAHDLMECGHEISEVFTFGSPRVGNGSFARDYNFELGHCTWRIVNARDPVPHVPWLLGTYRHVDTQVYLAASGEMITDHPLSVAANELAQTIGTVSSGQAAKALLDIAKPHHIETYIAKLKKALA